jgi:hypothetical protein
MEKGGGRGCGKKARHEAEQQGKEEQETDAREEKERNKKEKLPENKVDLQAAAPNESDLERAPKRR